LLQTTQFNLDAAILMAEASAAAYSAAAAKSFADDHGFTNFTSFDTANIKGFWCAADKAALLAFRGTSNIAQWIRDLHVLPATTDWGWAHLGFVQGIEAVEANLRAFDAVAKTKASIWIVGHSLGGALAVLAAARAKIRGIGAPLLYTYGQPAVSAFEFAGRFDQELPGRLWRLINQEDIVPRVPPFYGHCGTPKHIIKPGELESTIGLEAIRRETGAPPPPRHYTQAETLREIFALSDRTVGVETLAAGASLEPGEPPQLDMLAFGRLQVALGAAEPTGLAPNCAPAYRPSQDPRRCPLHQSRGS
jgi:hypothetical protein